MNKPAQLSHYDQHEIVKDRDVGNKNRGGGT